MNSKSINWTLRACGLLAASLCLSLLGCVGATRMPTRNTSPAGSPIGKDVIDLAFVQVGQTHREDVTNKLAVINTSYSNPRLFWGRWSESRWGYWWIVVMPCNGCGAGNAKRKWNIQNMLVAFDENGVVTSKETIHSDEALWSALHKHLLETPPPPTDLSQPVRISLSSREPAGIVLTKDAMEFERTKRGKSNVQISALKVVRFTHGTSREKKTNPGDTCHALEFSEKTTLGRRIKFCAGAAEVGALFQYLQQAGSPTMLWQ